MNILYLANHLNIGGITSYLLNLATGLKQRGHNVYIASSGGELFPRFTEGGVTCITIPIRTKQEASPRVLWSALKLRGMIRKDNIDLLHSQTRTTQVLGCLLNSFTGVVHVSTCHGFFKRRLSRALFPCWGKKVIAISEAVKEHLVRDFKVDEGKISVIHNGIDVNKFKARSSKSKTDIKKSLGLGDGLVVGIVARLSDVKGHPYLIEAMAEVLEAMPQTQLLIVGEGKMKPDLVNLTERLGIAKKVFFIPSVMDTQGVLSAMDLFVMPSLKEGLGLAAMEAMAGGLCVIGSDVGGIRSLIQDGYNGVLVRPKNTQLLSRAILELLSDEQKRSAFGQNAQRFIYKKFSLEKMVKETEEVYSGCVGRGR